MGGFRGAPNWVPSMSRDGGLRQLKETGISRHNVGNQGLPYTPQYNNSDVWGFQEVSKLPCDNQKVERVTKLVSETATFLLS